MIEDIIEGVYLLGVIPRLCSTNVGMDCAFKLGRIFNRKVAETQRAAKFFF
jgi:hypothetical protein